MAKLLLFNDLDVGSKLAIHGMQIASFLGSVGDGCILRLAACVPGGHGVYYAEKKGVAAFRI